MRDTIGHLELRPTGAITPFVTSITPPGYDNLPGNVEHTLPFEVTWTGARECAEKDEVFTGSLDVVTDGSSQRASRSGSQCPPAAGTTLSR